MGNFTVTHAPRLLTNHGQLGWTVRNLLIVLATRVAGVVKTFLAARRGTPHKSASCYCAVVCRSQLLYYPSYPSFNGYQ
jgi:hypothetical protein